MESTPESSQRWTCVASWVTMGTSLPSSLSTSLWIRTELLGVCLHHDQWLRSPLSSERLKAPLGPARQLSRRAPPRQTLARSIGRESFMRNNTHAHTR